MMIYTENDVVREIRALVYLLPKRDDFTEMMRAHKFAPMQIAVQRYADFVTGNLNEYLRFLKTCGIRAVMFSLSYYGEADLEDMYTLEDKDKSLFAKRSAAKTQPLYRSIAVQRRMQTFEQSDYSDYLSYSRFVCQSVDLSHPKELRLYSVCQGRVIACQLADAWLMRLNLMNRMALRQYAMENNLGAGSVQFRFRTAQEKPQYTEEQGFLS